MLPEQRTVIPRDALLFVWVTAACTGSPRREEPDADIDADIDTDVDSDTDSDSDACEHPADPVPCERTPRSETGSLDEEVCIPGGWFRMGTDDPESLLSWRPRHWVEVSPFFLDHFPVTLERYGECVDAGACPVPEPDGVWDPMDCDDPDACAKGGAPWWCPRPCGEVDPHSRIDGVAWEAAAAFCSWDEREGVPARLPTEAEYERAEVGLGCVPRTYPWGEAPPTCERVCMRSAPAECADDGSDTGTDACDPGNYCVVDSRPAGESEDRVAALMGTALVPIADCFVGDFYSTGEAQGPDPLCGPGSALPECKGCGAAGHVWRGNPSTAIMDCPWQHLLARRRTSGVSAGPATGIRCARDAR